MQATFCKILVAPLLALAGFCAFGFLETFEPLPPMEQWIWRAIYVVMCLCCLWATARLWRGGCKAGPNRKPAVDRKATPAL
jgi:hypothetical protein